MLPLQRFLFYGLLGCFVEICWTTGKYIVSPGASDVKRKRIHLKGETYVWMFPIYAFGLFYIFETLYIMSYFYPFYIRGTLYATVCLAIEYMFGYILYKTIGSCPWDYSDSKFSFHGFIRWDYGPVWGVGGLLLEQLYHMLELSPEAMIF